MDSIPLIGITLIPCKMKPTNYPMKNPRFPWKYKILEWKCEYDGHYDLELGLNYTGISDPSTPEEVFY